MPTLHETIVRPVITEKTSEAYQTRGEYTFEVASAASKGQIRQAVERLFAVKVRGVWTSNVRGKGKRVGKSVGTRPNWKKAIVTLKEGTIEIFEG
jgi:large subunit ribosomal protein L23